MTDPRFDDRLDAFISGDLAGEERAAFERDLAADPVLRSRADEARRALDDVREWLAADPPGIERAASLALPPAAPAVIPLRRSIPAWLQAAAAIFLFIAGYAAGQINWNGRDELGGPSEPGGRVATHPSPTPDSRSPTPDSRSPIPDSPSPRVIALADGRLRVEAPGSVWFVDPDFDMAARADAADFETQP